MKTIFACLLLALAVVVCATTDDVTGKWTGTLIVGDHDPNPALLVLKQDGSAITGTAGPSESEQWPIQNGKIDGNKVVLEVNDHERSLKLDLILDGDKLAGDVTGKHGDETMHAKLDLARMK